MIKNAIKSQIENAGNSASGYIRYCTNVLESVAIGAVQEFKILAVNHFVLEALECMCNSANYTLTLRNRPYDANHPNNYIYTKVAANKSFQDNDMNKMFYPESGDYLYLLVDNTNGVAATGNILTRLTGHVN